VQLAPLFVTTPAADGGGSSLLVAQVTAFTDRDHSESLMKIYSFPC
jgi:hypothetical protein